VPTLDASLGQGPVQILTPEIVFSCNAPTTTADWATVTNPIVTVSQVESGGLSQYSTVVAKGDLWYRGTVGIWSLILGRRDFATWGNVPMSREVSDVLKKDDTALLQYSSAVVFDNRLLMTVSPVFTQHGVLHRGWVALNFDLISSLRGKAPTVWESVGTGISVLQFVKGRFNDVERCFAFVLNAAQEIEFWEILNSETDVIEDNDQTPIIWSIETAALDFRNADQNRLGLNRLEDGEGYFYDVKGRVDVTVYWRADEYPCWNLWTRFSLCAALASCGIDPLTGCSRINNVPPQIRDPIGFGKPEGSCDEINDRPLTDGKRIQFRFVIQGHMKYFGSRFMSSIVPEPKFAKPLCTLQEDVS